MLLAQFARDSFGRWIEIARLADDLGPAAAVIGQVP
jgi:hypothetical protein